jgi:hypothetical protein
MKTQLANNKTENITISQAGILMETILRQNYLQFDKFYQPHKAVAMGSPTSGLVAEMILQNYEQHLKKNIPDSNKIIFYNRYVNDIIIIYDTKHTNMNDIQNYVDKIHLELQFKATDEIDNTISFLDLLITRGQNKLSINIYRKPTTTDTTIHYKFNYSL